MCSKMWEHTFDNGVREEEDFPAAAQVMACTGKENDILQGKLIVVCLGTMTESLGQLATKVRHTKHSLA